MKIRHKTLGVELEVEEKSSFILHDEGPYYISRQGSYLAKLEWELCDPPELWVDVTGDCEIDLDHDAIVHTVHGPTISYRRQVIGREGAIPEVYRLRKVQLEQVTAKPIDPHSTTIKYETLWAFLVDRREL